MSKTGLNFGWERPDKTVGFEHRTAPAKWLIKVHLEQVEERTKAGI